VGRDSRRGELLWKEWTGEGYNPINKSCVVFFTEDHIDLEVDVIKRALASAIQREGIASSLGDSFRMIDSLSTVFEHGYAGEVDGDIEMTVCNDEGETQSGDEVDIKLSITWVELPT
jgi:hypothetical protein